MAKASIYFSKWLKFPQSVTLVKVLQIGLSEKKIPFLWLPTMSWSLSWQLPLPYFVEKWPQCSINFNVGYYDQQSSQTFLVMWNFLSKKQSRHVKKLFVVLPNLKSFENFSKMFRVIKQIKFSGSTKNNFLHFVKMKKNRHNVVILYFSDTD